MMFGNAIYILNSNRYLSDPLYEENSSFGPINALLNQYLVAIGEFSLDNFSTNSSKDSLAVWLLFILATVFSQIIILNMLIAIMGDTFDKIWENKPVYVLRLKVELLCDFSIFLGGDSKNQNNFLFVATSKQKEDVNEDEW